MATLLLIRHGQASFLSDDYDHLSPLGEEQARRLGAHLSSLDLVPDRVLTGPLRRQRRTAELAAEASGRPWPVPIELAALREHEGALLLREHLPAVASGSREVADLLAQLALPDADRARLSVRLLDRVLRAWSADPAGLGVEPFAAFLARVRLGLDELTSRGRLVLAFTSGGVIGALVAAALACPDRTALELGLQLYNTGVTELLFSPGRLGLRRFNDTEHLPARLRTLL